MKKLTAAILILACLCQPATAVTSFGNIDCGKWIQEPSAAKRHWLAGYMSGLADMFEVFKEGKDPLNSVSSADQMVVWMNNFCQKNPLLKVSDGGLALFSELVNQKK